MKAITKTKKTFDTIEMMRSIRTKIDNELVNMTIEQQLDYYKRKSEEFRKKTSL